MSYTLGYACGVIVIRVIFDTLGNGMSHGHSFAPIITFKCSCFPTTMGFLLKEVRFHTSFPYHLTAVSVQNIYIVVELQIII